MGLTAGQHDALYFSRKRRKMRLGFFGPFDKFNRPNQNLEADTLSIWTRIDGIAGGAAIESERLKAVDIGAVGTSYVVPELGSANHYVQAAWLNTASAPGPFICARLTDANNFVGARRNNTGGAWELYKRVAGTFTLLGSFTTAIVAGDILRLECLGDGARVLVNGVERIAQQSLAGSHAGVTRAGLMARLVAQNPWIDDFRSGKL